MSVWIDKVVVYCDKCDNTIAWDELNAEVTEKRRNGRSWEPIVLSYDWIHKVSDSGFESGWSIDVGEVTCPHCYEAEEAKEA